MLNLLGRQMKIAILEITALPTTLMKSLVARQYASVFPQAIACWAEDAGHNVDYKVYSGNGLLPRFDAPDVLFVRTTSQYSILAYIAARRQPAKTLTVIGGPHAVCNPDECSRYFDVVVDGPCNRELILALCERTRTDRVTHSDPPDALPSLEKRWPLIKSMQSFIPFFPIISLLSSLGCGRGCSFCIDWNNRWQSLPSDRLKEDLSFIQHKVKWPILFQDPNVGRHIDTLLDTMESIGWRHSWSCETDIQSLSRSHLERLKRTGCFGIGTGIESWMSYNHKIGPGIHTPQEKYDRVTESFESAKPYVPLMIANIIWPSESDCGETPLRLTKSLMQEHNDVWCVLNFPSAYNRTPMFKAVTSESRLLPLPYTFQANGYMSIIPKNYSAREAIESFVELERTSERSMKKAGRTGFIKFISWVYKHGTGSTASRLLAAMDQKEMARFHEGLTDTVPEWYWSQYRRMLGPYASEARQLEGELH